jgi:hypothetical protein
MAHRDTCCDAAIVPLLGAKRTSVVSVPNVITSPGDAASLH